MNRLVTRVVLGLAANVDEGTPLFELAVRYYTRYCLPGVTR